MAEKKGAGGVGKRSKAKEDEMTEKRIVILDQNKCKPNMPAWTYFKKYARQCGKECITVTDTKTEKSIKVWENACAACLTRAAHCPDNAAKVLKLPSNLTTDTTHRYGPNSFKLHGLPMPRPGLVLGMLGCNGTGKSTACQILAGKMKPNLGNYDNPPSWKEIVKYYRGSDLQSYFTQILEEKLVVTVKPQMDSGVNKALAGRKVGDVISGTDLAKRGEEAEVLEAMELTHLLERDITELSGGELQRMAIATVALKDANVYIFDEPTSFLDVKQRLRATKLIRSLCQTEGGVTRYVVVIEHDLAVLDYMSDFVHCLYGEPGCYGVVTQRANIRNGINNFLAGYIPQDNMRFRAEELTFKVSTTTAEEKQELGLGVDSEKTVGVVDYGSMTKVLSSGEGESAKTFTLHIEPGSFTDGEVIGMLGENGMGKTTYMQMLAGLYDVPKEVEEGKPKEYDAVEVSLLGLGITMSYKRQDYAPKFRRYTKTVRELLERNTPAAFTDTLFRLLVMKPLRMAELLDLNVSTLSGGELQRLAIVVCIGTPALVYLIDEPSAGLDCEQRVIVAKVIKRWCVSHLNRSVFVIEHDSLMMSALADRMILFTGRPGIEATASSPRSVQDGFNGFLESLDVTFRRDPVNHRPRVNKLDSVKDREQKAAGTYFLLDVAEDDD